MTNYEATGAELIKVGVDRERKRIIDILRELELTLARTEGNYLDSQAPEGVSGVGNGIGYSRECLNVAISEIEKK